MPDLLLPTLGKVLLPAFGIAAMLFVAKRKGLSLSEDLGLRAPAVPAAVGCLVLWLLLIAAEELLTGASGEAGPKRWPEYPTGIVLLRVAAIGILGPIAEELAVRGLLMGWLKRTRLGVHAAILVSAALWAVIHLQYTALVLLIIFVDGVALGYARQVSRSIYVPITMHIVGNLYSIGQSLGRW